MPVRSVTSVTSCIASPSPWGPGPAPSSRQASAGDPSPASSRRSSLAPGQRVPRAPLPGPPPVPRLHPLCFLSTPEVPASSYGRTRLPGASRCLSPSERAPTSACRAWFLHLPSPCGLRTGGSRRQAVSASRWSQILAQGGRPRERPRPCTWGAQGGPGSLGVQPTPRPASWMARLWGPGHLSGCPGWGWGQCHSPKCKLAFDL